ncbi:MAG: 2-C-methyl-D-erythritol 4-phosphate cytidylyltransferase [Lachnospiraceae bacterium]|nr:2-C-methyl-D-erythritol 4-phosphate cytidylyltransferase [Lachnospiraceae bacterium]
MNIAIVLAGGTGTRLGAERPKQYIEVNEKPIIAYSVQELSVHAGIDAIWIVADEMWRDYICKRVNMEKVRGFSTPGTNRQLSIWNALCDLRAVADPESVVFIHDAARPILTADMITDYLHAIGGADGVLPVLPMKDTVYLSEDGTSITSLLKRSHVVAGQAPELFVYEKYYEANRALFPDRILQINGSTEPAILAGMKVVTVPGEERNFKITTQADLERFRRWVESNG